METNPAKPMGSLLPGIIESPTGEIVSASASTMASASLDLTTIKGRLDNRTLDLVREVANSSLPEPQRCDETHFLRCLKSLDILPRKADDTGGALRLKLYQAKLGGFSNEAMSYLTSKALEECHWFPTIAECLKILSAFPNREVASERRETARHLIRQEMNTRMDEAVARLSRRELDQAEIDTLPEAWKLVAAEKCFLWAWPDGRFTVRLDVAKLPEDEQEAEREKVRDMMLEWAVIKAEQSFQKDAAE